MVHLDDGREREASAKNYRSVVVLPEVNVEDTKASFAGGFQELLDGSARWVAPLREGTKADDVGFGSKLFQVRCVLDVVPGDVVDDLEFGYAERINLHVDNAGRTGGINLQVRNVE